MTLSNKGKQPKEKPLPCCEHCGEPVHDRKDGGKALLRWEITGLPSRTVWLHNQCLSPFLSMVEASRRTITPGTSFDKELGRLDSGKPIGGRAS